MRSVGFAELLLLLVTGPERAASTVGDLMEDAPGRGTFWFWTSVCRTALSFVWSDFAAEPAFLAGLAFRALLVNIAVALLLLIGMSVGIGIVLGAMVGLHIISPAAVNLARHSPIGDFAIQLMDWSLTLIVQYLLGRWIARRAHGREIAGCVAFLTVDTLFMIVFREVFAWLDVNYWHFGEGVRSVQPVDVFNILANLVCAAALIAGAVQVRRRLMQVAQ